MTDLSHKFSSFEEQSTAQHTELMAALNTIAFALGAPPTIPTTSLADVVTAINTLSDTLSAMYTANGGYYVSSLNTLELINISLDTMLNNNSLNAQRTIAAIYATFCACATTAPVLSPPLDITPTTLVNDAKCRRIQFYLHVFGQWLSKIANYGSSASFITGDTIGTLLSLAATEAGIVATGAEVGAAAGPPGIVIGAIVGLIVGAIFTFGGSVLVDYANQFNASVFQHTLLMALYNANSADEGYAAFTAAINAEFSTIPAGILNAMFWYEWSNDIYATVPIVDDRAFDGSICAPVIAPACLEITSAHITTSGGGAYQAITTDPTGGTPGTFANTSSGSVTTSPASIISSNLAGWTMRPLGNGVRVTFRPEDPSSAAFYSSVNVDHGQLYTFTTTGTLLLDNGGGNDVAISARFCPPGIDNPAVE